MRHRDDDLEPFREDPVLQALTGPASPAELAGEADALAAYRGAAPVPPQRSRSAARVATGTTAVVLILGVSGGVAAAYGNYLPDSWQKKVHDAVPKSLGVPAPPVKTPAVVTPITPAPVSPVQSVTPTYTPTKAPTGKHTPKSDATPSAVPSTAAATPVPTESVPVVVPTPTVSASATPTPTPTSTVAPPPVTGAQLGITVSASSVTVGSQVAVSGKLTDAEGNAVANRRVALIERTPGASGRHRFGAARTSAQGEVTFTVPNLQRNTRFVLKSGRAHSQAQRVIVTPIIHVEVPPTAPGQTSVTVSVLVTGGQPGDAVVLRGPGAHQSHRATLDASGRTTFTVPVSPSQRMNFQVVVQRTRAHGAHALSFYVPPSGG